jgi:hypothetical protein
MQVLINNTNKHISKVKKSIQNKLFDLLIDLDDELAHGYTDLDVNLMLKANIIRKILVDAKLMPKIVKSNTTTVQDITFLKMRDNTIQVQSIVNYDKVMVNNIKSINQLTLYTNPNSQQCIKEAVKKYQINMIPMYNYMNQQKKNCNKIIEPKIVKFKDLAITANRFKISVPKLAEKPKNFNESLKQIFKEDEKENNTIQIVIDPDDFESEEEDLKEIKQEYTQYPFLLENSSDDEYDDEKLNKQKQSEKKEKLNKFVQNTQYIGKRSINHKDNDREKYINNLKNSKQDVD